MTESKNNEFMSLFHKDISLTLFFLHQPFFILSIAINKITYDVRNCYDCDIYIWTLKTREAR